MTAPGFWPDQLLVYGKVCENLVFIPRDIAVELAQTWKAINASKTWGELRRALPESEWELVQAYLEADDNRPALERFLAEERETEPDLSDEDGFAKYRDLPVGQRWPFDEDPLERGDVPQFLDGDWPTWTDQAMLDWLPEEVQKQFGTRDVSMLNGFMLSLDPADATAIVEALQALGYLCIYNEELVGKASGQ